MASGFFLKVAALTHPGRKRRTNQDFVTFFDPRSVEELERNGALFIVADGVGGAVKGEKASKFAAEYVLHYYFQNPQLNPVERLQLYFRQTGNEIFDHAEYKEASGPMATTMVAALVRGTSLTVSNVGDSRAYLIREGKSHQITEDHTEAERLVKSGQMSRAEAHLSDANNKLTKSLGGQRDVSVDIFTDIPLQTGDQILLCSDGLTRYASPEDLVLLTSEGSPGETVERMVEFANDSGGGDNISVISIMVGEKAELEEILELKIAYEATRELAERQTVAFDAPVIPIRSKISVEQPSSNILQLYRQHFSIALFVVSFLCVVMGGFLVYNTTIGNKTADNLKDTNQIVIDPTLTKIINETMQVSARSVVSPTIIPDTPSPYSVTMEEKDSPSQTPSSMVTEGVELATTDVITIHIEPDQMKPDQWCVYVIPENVELTIMEILNIFSISEEDAENCRNDVFEGTGGTLWSEPEMWPNGWNSDTLPSGSAVAINCIKLESECQNFGGVLEKKPETQ